MSPSVTTKRQETLEIPISGMDCSECARHVHNALENVSGVDDVQVLLGAEKAILYYRDHEPDLAAIRETVKNAGYGVPTQVDGRSVEPPPVHLARQVSRVTAVVFLLVFLIVVLGEWAGLFDRFTERIPYGIGLIVVMVGGYPVFLNVLRATIRRQVLSHSLMTMGVIAALAVGQWVTALVVVFFMRIGDYVENLTTGRARQAVKDLSRLAPQSARVIREGEEIEVPVGELAAGEIVVVRPGEMIPVDGVVVAGHATVDRATITGESLPTETGPGSSVFAATMAQLGSLRIRVTHVGTETTFGRVIRLVEEAEAHRGEVQRIADRFSAYYLPIVAGIALLTLIIGRDPIATAAVLVVACSCSIALATPIAMMASIGAAAKAGVLIKGGKHIESLGKADILLIDKTGTVTFGRPRVSDIVALNGQDATDLLLLVASVERYSEHPIAEAIRTEVRKKGLDPLEPEEFVTMPGKGVRARVNGRTILVGSQQLVNDLDPGIAAKLKTQGKTMTYVMEEGELLGYLALSDTLRPEVPEALARVKKAGIAHIELLTGDNENAAAALAADLGLSYRANMLPEEKIEVVKTYQQKGHVVIMVGDGVNDAPALAQADVGIAMGVTGSDIALEAAHVALMRDDWHLVPDLIEIARRTMGVVKLNLGFTAIYNIVGLSLAAFGILPPVLAAAAQSLPDLGILANSSRLLRRRPSVGYDS